MGKIKEPFSFPFKWERLVSGFMIYKVIGFSRAFGALLNFSVDIECFVMWSEFRDSIEKWLLLLWCAKMNLIVKPIRLRILRPCHFLQDQAQNLLLYEAVTGDCYHMAISYLISFTFKYLKHTTGKILF